MKKQLLIIVLIGLMTLNFNSLVAQNRQEKPRHEQVETLTDEQVATVNKILADYNSESLTKKDAKAIMKALREAKIPRGKGIEKAINAAGFDFEEIRKLAPPPSRRGGKSKKN